MIMNFRTWMEEEGSINSVFPEVMPPVNRGTATSASAEVQRTGLQPQVNSEEIHTKQKDDRDRLLAIDSIIKHADAEIPQGDSENARLQKFKKLWTKFKEKWDNLKEDPENPLELKTMGLGSAKGNQKISGLLQQKPNVILSPPDGSPTGPSVF